MKRFAAAVLAMLMLCCAATAEELIAFEEYAGGLAGMYESEWKGEGLIRMLKTDGGAATISVCLRGEDVAAVTVETGKDGALAETAINALNSLKLLSDEILGSVSMMAAGEELTADGYVIGRLAGETRECIYFASEAVYAECLWEPVHGGDQLHRKPDCSGMDVPRLITPEAALETGYDPCDHCAKEETEQ